jgi:hypothetical protein
LAWYLVMIYLNSLLAGAGGAIVAALLWILISFVLPIVGPMVVGRFSNRGGMAGASIGSVSILLAAVIGFAVGAGLAFWRLVGGNCS